MKQIAANRVNAQKSTGPKTSEGKRIVSQNPIQHGLLAVNPVCLPEEQEEYERFVAQMGTQWQAEEWRERLALDRLIDCAWRLRRVTKIETSLLVLNRNKLAQQANEEIPAGSTLGRAYVKANRCLVNLSRHERQLERSYQAALQELRCLQYARNTDSDPFYIANMKKQPALDLGAAKRQHEGHFPRQPSAYQPPRADEPFNSPARIFDHGDEDIAA